MDTITYVSPFINYDDDGMDGLCQDDPDWAAIVAASRPKLRAWWQLTRQWPWSQKGETKTLAGYRFGDDVTTLWAAFWKTLLVNDQSFRQPGMSQDYSSAFQALIAKDDVPTDIEEMLYYCWQRSFVVTEHGYPGLAPHCEVGPVQVGDLVCILQGSRVPIVLRRGTDEARAPGCLPCTWVGDAYVHGIMHGEWLEANATAVPQQFELT